MSKIKLGELLRCAENQNLYDANNFESILAYAKSIEGKTIYQILLDARKTAEEIELIKSKETDKGLVGKIIEATYFGYKLNSKQEADFEKVGLELKSTPADKDSDGNYVSGETLSITQINFSNCVEKDFYNSHLWDKLKWLLIIFYFRDRALASKLNYSVFYATQFKPSEKDKLIILQDYNLINSIIESGNAYKLSRSDGTYLSTAPKATKGTPKAQSIYGGPEFTARAYTLRKPYIQQILDNRSQQCLIEDCIVKNYQELKYKTFIEILQDRFSPFIGRSISAIYNIFGLELKYAENKKGKGVLSKSTYSFITAKMLNVTTLRNEEFLKAGIVVKTIVFNKNGINKEKFRLSDADFMEINNLPPTIEGWEDSELYNQLDSLKYLFIVFQEEDDDIIFRGTRLWSMTDKDIELAYLDWLDIKRVLNNGVILKRVPWGDTERTENNFPGIADARRIHLRPHGEKSFYVDEFGKQWGNGSPTDTVTLPDGKKITRQSYWLDSDYVRSFVLDLIKTKETRPKARYLDPAIVPEFEIVDDVLEECRRFRLIPITNPDEINDRFHSDNSSESFVCKYDTVTKNVVWYGRDQKPCPFSLLMDAVGRKYDDIGYKLNLPTNLYVENTIVWLVWGRPIKA